jgi:TetR/AcrR family transcriptional regulator, mexJK operon transcriptional repressor
VARNPTAMKIHGGAIAIIRSAMPITGHPVSIPCSHGIIPLTAIMVANPDTAIANLRAGIICRRKRGIIQAVAIMAINRKAGTTRTRAAIIRSRKREIIQTAAITAINRKAGTTRTCEGITLRSRISIIHVVTILARHKVIMARNRATTISSPAIKQTHKKSATGKRPSKLKRHTGGRPSREAAALLGERILDVATELFLRSGYGATRIEIIARDARVSKRTLYQRFPDKAVLFTNVVHRIVKRLRPPNEESFFEGDDLEDILRRLARFILDATLTPDALALHRIIIAEATRFPELAIVVSQGSAGAEAVRRIGALFERETSAGRLFVRNPPFVAAQFLYMVVSVPQRRALGMGKPMSAAERAEWVKNTVDLLLNGCRSHPLIA